MSMVERVARKLAGQYMIDDGFGESSRASAESGEMWRNFRGAARVAINAMREPTDAMLDVGDAQCDVFKHADSTWNAMIDAALAEPATEPAEATTETVRDETIEWARYAAKMIIEEFEEKELSLDTADYRINDLVMESAHLILEDADLARRVGAGMEPSRRPEHFPREEKKPDGEPAKE